MRIQDLAQLSTRMFKTNPMRTWLTILGMGVGTGAVVVLVGLGFGLQKIILEQIVFGETLLSLGVTPTGSSQNIRLDQEAIEEFKEIDNVLDVSPMARIPALVTYKGLTGSVFIQGVEPAFLRYAGIVATDGETFTDDDIGDVSSVMLSPAILKLFGDAEPKDFIGEKISFRLLVPAEDATGDVIEVPIEKEYRVRGITKDDSALNVIMMLPELKNYVGITEFEKAQVRVENNEALPIVEEKIGDIGFMVTALSKTVEQATKIFQGIQVVLATFGGIALVVSAIGMFNTMTVTLLERTKEIGIMRTLGASPTDVKNLFISESVVVGFLGGVSGIVMGVVLGISSNIILNFVAKSHGGQAVQLFSFPLTFLLFIAVFSAVVGYLTGVFPARRAAKLNPLDAIRYE